MGCGKTRQSGQTLLEAIVAIGILASAITAALSLTVSSLSAEQDALSAVIGGNLAREAVEVVRMIRDSNWLAGRTWDEGLHAGTDYGGVPILDPGATEWRMDFQPSGIMSTRSTVYRQVTNHANITVGMYRHFPTTPQGSVVSGFRRFVTLYPICADALGALSVRTSGTCPVEKVGIQATALVTWTVAGRKHQVQVQESLYDWR